MGSTVRSSGTTARAARSPRPGRRALTDEGDFGDGEALFEAVRKRELEGVVAG
jgi:hypothetical protein